MVKTLYELEEGHLFRFVGQEEYHVKLRYADHDCIAIDCQSWGTFWTNVSNLVEDLGPAKIGVPK